MLDDNREAFPYQVNGITMWYEANHVHTNHIKYVMLLYISNICIWQHNLEHLGLWLALFGCRVKSSWWHSESWYEGIGSVILIRNVPGILLIPVYCLKMSTLFLDADSDRTSGGEPFAIAVYGRYRKDWLRHGDQYVLHCNGDSRAIVWGACVENIMCGVKTEKTMRQRRQENARQSGERQGRTEK